MKASHLKNTDKLELIPLEFKFDHLEPVLDEDNVKYHYQVLSQGYVDRYNKQEGDLDFNKAGALLHNIWWPQLTTPKLNNKPIGSSKLFIEKHFTSWEDFRDQFNDQAMLLQGSGWIYLAKDGSIKTIHNHQWKNDILLIIDLWEHSFYLDYPADKKTYIRKIWQIINWSVISDRVNLIAKA